MFHTGTGQLGKVLQEFRQRAGLTQQEAADLAGLSVAGLRDVEQGRVLTPRAQTLRRLGGVLGLSDTKVEELLKLARPGRSGVSSVWIGVLGPLVVRVGGEPVDVGSETQRSLLGLLALSPNAPVGRQALLEGVWGADPPPTAADALPTRISRLRRRLQPHPAPGEPPVLTSVGSGYQLTASDANLDLLVVRDLIRQARQARDQGHLAAACDLFGRAAELWRAEPLNGIAALTEHPAVVGLVRQWHAVVVDYATAAIELGLHERVVPLLERVIASDPLHEVAHARLMVALTGAGQQAAALNIFDTLRRRLAEELGTDPGPELAQAHLRVLRQEVPRPEVAPVNAHRQLPPDIADFYGRRVELRELFDRIPHHVDGATAGAVISIEGMAGVGKSRLAIHLAHRLLTAGRFEEQQLYVDLHGHADQPPADPAAVLGSFLRLLGVPGGQIPSSVEERSALYRDRLYGKRALILLDNAANEEQVRPLLPAGPTNLVLLTSRRTLAVDGAHTLALDVFTRREAVELLARAVGTGRVNSDPAAADRVVERCGRLPLAVALVARRLQARPAWTLADLATRLADDRQRLGEVAAGTRRLRAVFDLSYQLLEPSCQSRFRLLGLHPGEDFTAEAVAALVDTTVADARQGLDSLVDEHLVVASLGNRYRMHDLLRDYAYELAQQDGQDTVRQATRRLLDWYVIAADAAQRQLFPERQVLTERQGQPNRQGPTEPQAPPAGDPRAAGQPVFTNEDAALGWLHAEHANLIAAMNLALDHEQWAQAWQLPATLRHYFERTGQWRDWLQVAESGLAAACRVGDRRGEVLLRSDVGVAHGQLGDLDQSVQALSMAVAASQQLDDPTYEAHTLNNLGIALGLSGQPALAVDHLQRALDLVRELDLPSYQARTLSNLGYARSMLGQYDAAIECLRPVIALQRAAGDPVGFANSLRNLSEALRASGQHQEAIAVLREALEVDRQTRARADEAETLTILADTLADSGDFEQARRYRQQALEITVYLDQSHAEKLRDRLIRHAS